jgi:signal transduction histidine kinase
MLGSLGARRRDALAVAVALAFIALILWLDVITPDDYSFVVFYVIPIVAITLLSGRRAGVAVAIAAAVGWTLDTGKEEGFYAASLAWNILTRSVIFAGLTVLIDLYRRRGERLAAVDRHREESFALVAHKLRQTAQRISSVTGAIAARDVDAIVTEARIALDGQARELHRMAEDVLDANLLEAGRFRLHVGDVDLTELVTEATREIGRGQVQLVLQADPVVVQGDPDRLRVVVWHLIANAVRYSPAGAPIFVTVSGNDAEAKVVVKDQGVGFGPSDLTVLFQKYGQAQTAKNAGGQGVGLGLYVARLLAEAHSGRITAESTGPGMGATFQLVLPIRQPGGATT